MNRTLDQTNPPSGFGAVIVPPWDYEPRIHNTSPVVDRGETRHAQFGPGWEESAGDGRPVLHDLTFGFHDGGAWSEDHMTGQTAVINPLPADHGGYQEPWGPEVTTPRNQAAVPWDAGITIGSGTV